MRSWLGRVALVCAVLFGATSGNAFGAKSLCADVVAAGGMSGELIGSTFDFDVVLINHIPIIVSYTEIGSYMFNGIVVDIDCGTVWMY